MLDRLFPDLSSFRGIFRLLCWESVFAVFYETWVGPTYISGLAGESGVDLNLVAVLAAIPWIGAAGQVVGTWAFERVPSFKRYTLSVAGAGRALWIIPLMLASVWGFRSRFRGEPFPTTGWFTAVAFSAGAASLLTSASATAWMSWMKATVPARFQGRFFGNRQRYVTSAFVIANLAAAALVGWKPEGYRVGSAVMCALALISGALSIWLHSRVPDVMLPAESTPPRTFRQIFSGPIRDAKFRRFLVFGASFHGAMQLSSSYFPYYFTRELHVPLSTIALWTCLTNLGCFLSAAFWGKRVDRSRMPYDVFWVTGHFVALSPLYYVYRSQAWVSFIAPLDYLVSGITWTGFILAQTTLLLRSSPRGKGAAYFSVYSATCGLTGAACTFLGGRIAQWFAHAAMGGFPALFLISSSARFLALWLFCRHLMKLQAKAESSEWRFASQMVRAGGRATVATIGNAGVAIDGVLRPLREWKAGGLEISRIAERRDQKAPETRDHP